MTPYLRKLLSINWILAIVVIGLGVFGVVCIHDAGNNPGWENLPSKPPDISQVYKRQQLFLAMGIVVMLATALINYRILRWLCVPMYLGSVAMLIYALAYGTEINDTKGWIDLGFISIQPSQLAMASAIITVSVGLGELPKVEKIARYAQMPWLQLLFCGVILGLPCLLVLGAGDVGSALVWLPVTIALLLVGRIPFRILFNLIILLAAALPLAYFFAIKDDESRSARIDDWLAMNRNEAVDTHGTAWAASRITMAIGSAGWEGRGRMNPDSVHGHGHIPMATCHTDFIYAVVAEQWGFSGAALLLIAFMLLLFLCLIVALFAVDQTGRLLVAGTSALLFAHIFQNVGMDILLVPITGIPLPLISYGGTFLLILCFLLGIVQSVWVHRELPEPKAAR